MKYSLCISVFVQLSSIFKSMQLKRMEVHNIDITSHLVDVPFPESSLGHVSLICCVITCIGNGKCLFGDYLKEGGQCQLKTADQKPRHRDTAKRKGHHFDLREVFKTKAGYEYYQEEKTWDEAKTACEKHPGSSLIHILNQQQQDSAQKLVENSGQGLIHIGVFHHKSFIPPSSEWKYTNKTIVSYTNWGEDEPGQLTHAAMKKVTGYKWAAVSDHETGGWICERRPSK